MAVVAAAAVAAIIFALSSDKTDKHKDNEVVVAVTDENGNEVTDSQGRVVTEVSSNTNGNTTSGSNAAQSQSQSQGSGGSSGNSSAGDNSVTSETTKKAVNNKQEETSRKIRLAVTFPYYDGKETAVKIEYKLALQSNNKYKTLNIKDNKIVLDSKKEQVYTIDESLKGDVNIRITLDGIELHQNDFVVKGSESQAKISLYSGMEKMDGGMD